MDDFLGKTCKEAYVLVRAKKDVKSTHLAAFIKPYEYREISPIIA